MTPLTIKNFTVEGECLVYRDSKQIVKLLPYSKGFIITIFNNSGDFVSRPCFTEVDLRVENMISLIEKTLWFVNTLLFSYGKTIECKLCNESLCLANCDYS